MKNQEIIKKYKKWSAYLKILLKGGVMKNKKELVDKILIGIDSGIIVIDGWKFRYNNKIKGIEAYKENESIVEQQNIYKEESENFEKVVERLLEKLRH